VVESREKQKNAEGLKKAMQQVVTDTVEMLFS